MKKLWLTALLCAAAGIAVLSCDFSNDAADEGADTEMQIAAGVIIENISPPIKPTDAWACCFSRQLNYGRINATQDFGSFNGNGDYRYPLYMLDDSLTSHWQTNYNTSSVTNNPTPGAPSSGEQHHYISDWDGRHYILLDLGEPTEFNTIHFYSSKGSYVTAYEIYTSDDWSELANPHPDFTDPLLAPGDDGDFNTTGDWNRTVSNPVHLIQAHGGTETVDTAGRTVKPLHSTFKGEGQLEGVTGWQKILLDENVTARYVMLRCQRAAASTEIVINDIYLEKRR